MARYDNTELLAGIRRKARLPAESVDYDDSAILLEADEVLLNRITQEILGTFQEHYTTHFDFSVVADQQAINIPGYNVGSVVRDVVYFSDVTTQTAVSLPRYDLSEIDTIYGNQGGGWAPTGHVFRDDQILLVPTPNTSTGTVRIQIEYRPGKLVPVAEAMEITAINTSTGELSGNAPASWTTSLDYDLMRVNSPHATTAFGVTPSAVSSGVSITFTPADLDFNRIAVGDYVALEGESPIAQCHAAFFTALQWGTAASILQQIGDHTNGPLAQQRFENGITEARHLISPRNKGEAEYIINRNGHMRANRSTWWNGRGLS